MITQLAADIAEAYTYGYPLVLVDVTREVMGRDPGRFTHVRRFPDASFTDVVTPNADTLYSTAFLDLARGPMLLTIPPSGGRYHLVPMLSGWSDIFASPGTRTTGNDGGRFVIVGPEGPVGLPTPPDAVTLLSPTSIAVVIGRTQVNGVEDYPAVHRFQDSLRLEPVDRGPLALEPAPAPARKAAGGPPPEQVDAMSPREYFERFARLLVANPPGPLDGPAVATLERIGLRPGSFAPPAEVAAVLPAGVETARGRISTRERPDDQVVNGWRVSRGLGRFGTDYLKRARVARLGLGANLQEDALYPHAEVDAQGHPLTGSHRYRLTFAPGSDPPAHAFWSLTMYDQRQYFVPNALGRSALGDRDPLDRNEDGSLDLRLQHEAPPPDQQSNWLPAPVGAFNVVLRLYWPRSDALNGRWVPPPIARVD